LAPPATLGKQKKRKGLAMTFKNSIISIDYGVRFVKRVILNYPLLTKMIRIE
jgi:hypothetical protein